MNSSNRRPILRGRSGARELMVQVLYEADVTGKPCADLLLLRAVEAGLKSSDLHFVTSLYDMFRATITDGDRKIKLAAPKRPLTQLATIDRAILRLATSELINGDTPPAVAIDEAVILAKKYGTKSSPRFINGVLGSIHRAEISQTDPSLQTRSLLDG